MSTEMLEHVEDRLEPEMLHPTLAFVINSHSQMLGSGLEVEC